MTTLLTYLTTRRGGPADRFLEELTEAQRRAYGQIPETVGYVYHPSFDSPTAGEEWFGEEAQQVEVPAWTHFPEVGEDVSARPAARMALSAAGEARLFLQYNYARYRLAGLIEAQRRRQWAVRARQMIVWYRRVIELQAKLVGANMALVLAMAKRTRIPNVDFSELVSEGNMALLRSVEKFDVSRGFKFSTYACRAILKSFHRLATNTGRYRQHFPTEFDPKLERSDYDVQRHERQRDDSVDALREILARNRAALSEVERTVLMERFAIGTGGKGRTLSEVGKLVGLTNERVRQIQNAALAKLRAVLDEDYLVA
ncbi:MAG: sigma-70 family RNA polymerase sigma factor [Phycisphaerae bacterium]|nr:sigma-70 family RNA polymerase sigma factor [Phycisphaerae bacterium]